MDKIKTKSLTKKINVRTVLMALSLIILVAWFQTLLMYFWNDDNAIVFKLQHLNEGVGNLGSGILGWDSPYRMVIPPLVPVYYLFGTIPMPYFVYGIIFYFLASISIFIFAKSLFRNDKQALFTGLIFASGAIGAESMWRVYNSVHTSITIIFMMLCFTAYFYTIRQATLKKKILLYFLTLALFALSVQWGYVRAHGIILVIIAIEFLYNFNWRYSIFRLAPFVYLFHKWYVADNPSSHHFSLLISQIFEEYKFELLLVPLKTLSNIFIPDIFLVPISLFLILFVALLIKFRSKIVFLSLVLMTGSYFIYFVMYSDISLNTTHRYLTTALPGLSIFMVYIFSTIFKSQRNYSIAIGAYIILHLALLNWTHYKILIERTIPTKNFYSDIKTEIKSLNKNSLIYFDIEESDKSKNQFKDFFGVGSMPDTTAIAIHFNIDRYDLLMPQTFDDAVNLIRENKISPENAYSFFYSSESGLTNTTPTLRKGIFGRNNEMVFDNSMDINFNSSAPLELKMNLNPKINYSKINYKPTQKLNNKNSIEYLNSKLEYYRNAEATSSTEWKYQEVEYLIDNDLETSWMSHRVHWHYNSHDQIIINLKQTKNTGAVRMVFGPTDKAPTKYSYACSVDGTNWTLINNFYHNPKNHGEEKIDKFPPVNCQFLKIELFDTPKKDAPIIREIEVIDGKYTKLDFQKIKSIESKPFDFITEENLSIFENYFTQNGIPINVCLLTNKSQAGQCKKLYVKINESSVYSLQFDPQGTNLKRIVLEHPDQLDLNLTNQTLKYLTLDEIK